jgi:predicted RNase H-like HicB family nuclease
MNEKTVKDYLKEPYTRIFLRNKDGRFSAEIMEFPGCYADGETPEEAYNNLDKVAESWIEVSLGAGREIPSPFVNFGYGGKIALRVSRSLHRQASRMAERDGVSLNQFILTAVSARVGADELYEKLIHSIQKPLYFFNFQKNITITESMLPYSSFGSVWESFTTTGQDENSNRILLTENKNG